MLKSPLHRRRDPVFILSDGCPGDGAFCRGLAHHGRQDMGSGARCAADDFSQRSGHASFPSIHPGPVAIFRAVQVIYETARFVVVFSAGRRSRMIAL